MTAELWNAIDHYIDTHVVGDDPALRAAIDASVSAGLPPIAVAPNQGKLLHLLARLQGASKILEIGTLAGYSTIWLARAVAPGGRVITLESEAKHADLARANIARAGLSAVIDVRVGKALDTLPGLAAAAPFDLIFIDADKQHIPEYFEWAVTLSKPGSLIVVDNVVRAGSILDDATQDPNLLGIRRFFERLAVDRRVSATTIQTVGIKGHDGLTLALLLDPIDRES
jgi:predicted O-methyltransferase YrrM